MTQLQKDIGGEVGLRDVLAFYGQANAKAKRFRLRHFTHVVFNFRANNQEAALERWMKEQTSNGVALKGCMWCKSMTPFYLEYCLLCTERERRIETMESNSEALNAASEKAMKEQRPFPYFGRVQTNGKCDLHEGLAGQAWVLTVHTAGKNELNLCGVCARSLLQDLLRDYWKEVKNKQDMKEIKIFWGNDPLEKTGGPILVLPGEAA